MKIIKKILGIILSLSVLLIFSFYAADAGTEQYPSTLTIISNPQNYENKLVEMRGKIIGQEMNEENITLFLERYGENYTVRYSGEIEEFKKLDNGDTIDLLGYSHLATKNYVQAIKIKHRPKERHSRMFSFSIAGLILLSLFAIKDRKKITEVLPLG